MTLRNLCCGIIAFASLTVNAGEILSSDQVNLLKIERRNLIEERDYNVKQIVLNEKKIEMLVAWANGDKPDTLKDKVAPAVGVIASGVATSATVAVLVQKYMPELLSRLPLNVQRLIKATPAIASIVIAAYYGHDSVEFHKLAKQITALTTQNSQQELYAYLLKVREYLGAQIEMLSLQINSLDAQLNLYE